MNLNRVPLIVLFLFFHFHFPIDFIGGQWVGGQLTGGHCFVETRPQLQIFRAYFFNSCTTQGNVQAIQLTLTGLLWWQKPSLLFQQFLLKICKLISQFNFAFVVSFHYMRSDVWQRRDFLGPIKILLLRIATKEGCSETRAECGVRLFSFWKLIFSLVENYWGLFFRLLQSRAGNRL